VSRALSLESGATVLSLEGPQVAALTGAQGFGMPDVDVRWHDGAGDGSTYRSSRQRRRVLTLPLLARGKDADDTMESLSLVARILDPATGASRLRLDMGDGDSYWTDVVRTGGGDYVFGKDTNGSSWAATKVTLEAGDSFWTRERASTQTVKAAGLGRGLLQGVFSLTKLRLSSGQAMGSVSMENPGDAPAFPVTVVNGPGTALILTSPTGETLTWTGLLVAGQVRVIDHAAGTIVDASGANKYAELGAAPRFWAVPQGVQTATVNLAGADANSAVTISWRPRRWLVL
jgi:hypothetical protein